MTQTKSRILDAAEKLFASRGIEKTSMRRITSEAGVNLAAINYHFGSKENLVKTVLGRFIASLDLQREHLLEEAEKQAGPSGITIRDVLRAFLNPWLAFKREHPELVTVFSRFYSNHQQATHPFTGLVRDKAREAYADFTAKAAEILPHVPRDDLLRRINLAAITAASFVVNGWLIGSLEDLSGMEITDEILLGYIVRILESDEADP